MVFREASNCFLTFETFFFTTALSNMTLFCSIFEHLECEWTFSMHLAGRHFSNSKASF